MRQARAINLAMTYAAKWAVPWRQLLKADKMLPWYFFFGQSYDFAIDTGDGDAIASVVSGLDAVTRFEYYPWDPKVFLLPLWAAFPLNNSVTMSWRMGYDERYKYRWHYFYRALSDVAKAEYRQKYPPPEDESSWRGFYEFIADKPATGEHPIVDFVIGRVP